MEEQRSQGSGSVYVKMFCYFENNNLKRNMLQSDILFRILSCYGVVKYGCLITLWQIPLNK